MNCAGMWARELGALAGVAVPLHASEHFYIVTEPDARRDAGPAGAARSRRLHLRARGSGRAADGRLRAAREAVGHERHPRGLRVLAPARGLGSLPGDDGAGDPSASPRSRPRPCAATSTGPRASRPTAATTSARRRSAATSSSPPDSTRSASRRAPARARRVAEWIVGGEPPMDLWDVDIRRVAAVPDQPALSPRPHGGDGRPALRDALAVRAAGDGARRAQERRCTTASPRAARASARCSGWERANWYARARHGAEYRYSWGRQNWFARSAEEHRAVREAVGLFDQSSFTKLRLEGPDARRCAPAALRERRRRAGRPHRLHADAERATAASSPI